MTIPAVHIHPDPQPDKPAEELVLDCARCPYLIEAHVDGRCPTEDEAVAAWGRS